jgi:hypothetical protein
MPQSRADVDPNFETQLKQLQQQAQKDSTHVVTGGTVQWMMPELKEWSGDLFDWKGMSSPFDRSVSNQAFSKAISDPANPGTTGDGVVASLQIDYLATLERAFRSRHTMRRPRAVCHAAARKADHGNAKGALLASLEYVRGLVKLSKDTPYTT